MQYTVKDENDLQYVESTLDESGSDLEIELDVSFNSCILMNFFCSPKIK